ncbi:flagellar hook protein [Opitutaceae bacterium EW11]|nr:flagellar hook protein [Opitutaceae bacterium EW11]
MSSSLALSGLASGFDWKTFIDTMIETQSAPITRLKAEKTANNNKITALSTLGTKITDLQTAAAALKADGLFSGRTATSTNTNWTASASSGTATGSYAINVTRLASATARNGTSDIGLGLSTTNDVSGVTLASMATAKAVTAGNFTVNGAQVSIALTDSLQDVFTKISTATGGTVTASYDSATDKISLNSASTIVLGASNDTSNFFSVTKLANNSSGTITSSGALGSVNQSAPLASSRLRGSITAVDGSGNGSFNINGVAIAYNVNTDSLSAVLNRINTSTAGVTATYDTASDRVVLTNKTTGSVGMGFSEAAGGFLDAAGITAGTTNVGLDAQYTVNGGPTLTSSSNTLDASSHGITGLSVIATAEGTSTIAVGSDTTSMRKKIEDFISKYNAVQDYIESQTKVTITNGKVSTSLMSDNREIQSWARSFRSAAFDAVSGVGGTIQRLENLGIDFTSGTSDLTIKDGTKLDAALADHSADVESFFKTATTGFSAKLDALSTQILGTGTSSTGWINTAKNTLTNSNTSIDNQIDVIQRQLDSQRARLEAAFTAMEEAQSKIQQQQQQIAKTFPSTG